MISLSYGCELPEGEDEPESSFTSVCKGMYERQEEQSLTQFSLALGDSSGFNVLISVPPH